MPNPSRDDTPANLFARPPLLGIRTSNSSACCAGVLEVRFGSKATTGAPLSGGSIIRNQLSDFADGDGLSLITIKV